MRIADRFKVLSVLSSGGNGTVYLVKDTQSGRRMAVKELASAAHLDFAALLSLKGPHLLSYEDFLENRFLLMEYLEGETLAQLLERKGRLSEQETIHIAMEICRALEELAPFIHGDIKPSNVMVTVDGIRLIDLDGSFFKGGRTDQLGTRGYAAPEQMGGRGAASLGAYTDIYNLGAVCLQLLSGIAPAALPIRSWQEKPSEAALGISEPLWSVLMKMVRMDPLARYQSGRELEKELQRLLETGSRRLVKRRTWALCVFPVFCFVTALAVGLSSSKARADTYERLLETAKEPSDFLQAIAFEPQKEKGYQRLLEWIREDLFLDSEEKRALNALVMGIDFEESDETRIVYVLDELKKGDEETYSRICKQIGELFLFYQGEEENESCFREAKPYFERAGEEQYLAITEAMQMIDQLDKLGKTEELVQTVRDFWRQIQELSSAVMDADQLLFIRKKQMYLVDRYLQLLIKVCDKKEILAFAEGLRRPETEEDNPFFAEEWEQLEQEKEKLLKRLGG